MGIASIKEQEDGKALKTGTGLLKSNKGYTYLAHES